MLGRISYLIKEGYTSGYDPDWTFECRDYHKLTETDLEYIGNLIRDGYKSGYDPIYWEIAYEEEDE